MTLLFGGTMSCNLPEDVHDASLLREVPDNQEVFLHRLNDQSVMVDIMEYQGHVKGQQSIRYHFEDLASANDAQFDIQSVEEVSKDRINFAECSEAWFLRGTQHAAKFNDVIKDEVETFVTLYRLPQFFTDILIVMNSPVPKGACVVHLPTTWTLRTFEGIYRSLRLHDTSLFGHGRP